MGNSSAPVIYFDLAPYFGTMNGVIHVELAGRVLDAGPDGNVAMSLAPAARIRCSPIAAQDLISALQKAIKMLEAPPAPAQGATNLN